MNDAPSPTDAAPAPWPMPPLPADLVMRRIPYDPASPLLAPYTDEARAFSAGRDTPRAFLERRLDVLATAEPSVRAFVLVDEAGARRAADAATARWKAGRPLGPVDGMPVAIKDMIETRDLPTAMNSPDLCGMVVTARRRRGLGAAPSRRRHPGQDGDDGVRRQQLRPHPQPL